MCFKMFHSNTKKTRPRVCQSRVCYLPTTRALTLGAGCLSSFEPLVWCTDFQTFDGDQRNSCHTMSDKTRQEAGSWALSPALMDSELSWWRYFFKLSDLIADSGPWYFQVCQGHSALWEPWMPLELWVLALISKKQPSCDKCLLSLNSRDLFLNLRRLVKMTKPLRFENKSLRLKYKCLICIWIIFWAILDLFINPKYLFQNKSFSQTYYFKSEKSFVILTSL